MAIVTFYEKPGCISNTRQRKLLTESGHALIVKNLLAQDWTPERLRPFFGTKPIPEWVNKTAPAVTSGAIDPETLTEDAALAAMCADPILIRRPLMAVAGQCRSGFDQELVHVWIGLKYNGTTVGDDCPRVAQSS